jgi:hypothetical protein
MVRTPEQIEGDDLIAAYLRRAPPPTLKARSYLAPIPESTYQRHDRLPIRSHPAPAADPAATSAAEDQLITEYLSRMPTPTLTVGLEQRAERLIALAQPRTFPWRRDSANLAAGFSALVECVATAYHVSPEQLAAGGDGHRRGFIEPRRHLVYLACTCLGMSLPAVASKIGYRDHTTALYHLRRVKDRLDREPSYAAQTKAVRSLAIRYLHEKGLDSAALPSVSLTKERANWTVADLEAPDNDRSAIARAIRHRQILAGQADVIIQTVAETFGLTKADFTEVRAQPSYRRDHHSSYQRFLAMYALRELCDMNDKRIANVLGFKDRTTVSNGCRQVSLRMRAEKHYADFVCETLSRCHRAALKHEAEHPTIRRDFTPTTTRDIGDLQDLDLSYKADPPRLSVSM